MLFIKTSLHASEVTSTGRTSSTEAEWSSEYQIQGESKEQYHLCNLRHKGFSSITQGTFYHISTPYTTAKRRIGVEKLLKDMKKIL